MRVKSPSIILAILLISIAVSSCLNTDETTEFSSNASVTAFGIDTIYGVEYDFEIDQIKNLIYNRDSLPMSADTILDKTLITTFSTAGMAVMSGDTVFNASDSVNLLPAVNKSGSEGMKFTVYAADGFANRTYTLQIRMHKQDPDSLMWKNMVKEKPVFSSTPTRGEQKAVILGGELLVFTSYGSVYRTSTAVGQYGWSGEETVTGLPADVRLSTILAYNGALYAVNGTEHGEVYRSADGLSWTAVPGLGNRVVNLVAEVGGNLVAVVAGETSGDYYFQACDGSSWLDTEVLPAVPDDFPLENLYATHATNGNGITKTLVAGTPRGDADATVLWSTEDGEFWVDYATYDSPCPRMERPFMAYYGGNYYIWGDEMDAVYASANGIAWFETETKFLLPDEFEGKTSYSIVIDPTVDASDKRDYIWVVFGGHGMDNEVWRGRLNKLGFEDL